MPAKKYFLSSVDLGREIRRPSLVGMQFFYKGAVSTSNLFRGCAGLNSKDLIGLLFCHFSIAANVTSVFPSIIISRVFTPVRFSPIQISGEQRAAVFIYFAKKPDQRLYVELIERGALMLPVQDTTAHGAGVVFKLHFQKGGAHARHSTSALLCAPTKACRPERDIAEDAETKQSNRKCRTDLTAHEQENGKQKRRTATYIAQHPRGLLGISFRKPLGSKEQQYEDNEAKKERGHVISSALLACSRRAIPLAAPRAPSCRPLHKQPPRAIARRVRVQLPAEIGNRRRVSIARFRGRLAHKLDRNPPGTCMPEHRAARARRRPHRVCPTFLPSRRRRTQAQLLYVDHSHAVHAQESWRSAFARPDTRCAT